jgi:1-acyl-sn-glycerol-3-phosphate acyltransferase
MNAPGWKRWGILAGAGVIFLLSLLLTQRLRLDEKITALLPETDPVVQQYVLVAERFQLLDAVYVDIDAGEDTPAARRRAEQVGDAFYDRLSRSPWFTSITYRFSGEQFLSLANLLGSRKARLLGAQDLQAVAARLGPAEISSRLALAKRRLIEPSGPFLKTRVAADPLDLDELIWKKLSSLREGGARAQVREGRLWTGDGRHLLMIALPNFPAVDTAQGRKLLEFLEEARTAALDKAPGGGVRLAFTGSHLATLDNAATIKADVTRSLLALSLGLALLAILTFRRPLLTPLVFFPAAFGLTAAAALFGLVNPWFSGVALGCGSILMGIAVDYGIPILYHLDQAGAAPDSRKQVVRSLALPLLMGAGTTIAGFAGLTLMPLPGQRQMGWFAVLGILLALLFALLVLPHCVGPPKQAARRPFLPLASWCLRFLEWRRRHGRLLWIISLIVVSVCAFGAARLQFEGDVSRLSHLSSGRQQDQDQVQGAWGSLTPTAAVVRETTLEAALAANDRLAGTLGNLQDQGLIAQSASLAAILPALASQEENLKKWREFWSPSRRAALQANLEQAAAALGFAPGAFRPFLEGLTQEPPPLTLDDLKDTALSPLLRTKLSQGKGDFLVLTTLSVPDRSRLPEVSARLQAALPNVAIMDKRGFVEHMTGLVSQEFHKLALISFLAITLCLFLFLLRVELVLVNLIPVFLSVLATLGLLGLMNIPVNLMSLLFVVFIFAVGVDFSLFLMSGALSRHRLQGGDEPLMAGTVVLCALTSTGGFAALLFARHPALFSMGITGVLAMLTSMAAALVVVPAFMAFLLPKEGRFGVPTLKTLAGAVWAFVHLAGAAQIYAWGLRFLYRRRHPQDLEARRRAVRGYMHRTAASLLRWFPYRSSRRLFFGAEPQAFAKPAVLVSNHQSVFDIMLILALPVDQVMLVKRWVWEAPFLGRLVRDAGYVLVGEEDGADYLSACRDYLQKGITVTVFPEGSRSPDGVMRRFHMGAFKLAELSGADVLPVLITNSQACIPYKAYWVAEHQTVVRVLSRVTPETFHYSRGARELARHVKHRMLAQAGPDWRLAQDGKPFWDYIRSLYAYQGAFVESFLYGKLKTDPLYRGLDAIIPETGAILDLGAGHGLLAAILARKSRGRRVVGVDYDADKVRVARAAARSLGNLEFRIGDVRTCELPAADVVLLIDLLHYWPPETQRRIIARAAAALTGGGILILREAIAAPSLGHRLVAGAEAFAVAVGHNRAAGLFFQARDFYLEAFAGQGLELVEELPGLARGSNAVLMFRRAPQSTCAAGTVRES